MNRMAHRLPEWFDLDRWLAGLQQFPVGLQFCPMDFRPRFYQSSLRGRQTTAQALDRVYCEYRRLLLVVRVKVRAMMLAACFDEHPDDDSKEPR